MGRDIKRVPVDFDWPLRTPWKGYLTPEKFDEDRCPDCKNGYSRYAEQLYDQWYGYAPFLPESTGSTPLTVETPAVWKFAQRNVSRSPEFYGLGDGAVRREAARLVDLWNRQWSHHLSQADVDVLVDGNRLWDFTRVARNEQQRKDVEKKVAEGGNTWLPYNNGYRPTASEVNEWTIQGGGRDSLDCSLVIQARCARDGQPRFCATCAGAGSLEKYPGQRAEAEAWAEEDHEPPTGDGWQVWETVSEGSPISPVFADREGLVTWLMSPANCWGIAEPLTREQAEGFVEAAWAPTGAIVAGKAVSGDALFG
ncbi:hypothetical protein [Mycobacteroides abscessus]|uniref:hypothetical protein n=1 Tax=Mycobacteroides abscessus TaxID=36809 RepID=UPI0009A64CCE|nr:hypothetical protein [Mycobacteroides abscessus]SLH41729.1 Uncharacterised protein [Mycobacteroides abscessus subsp. massiliense]